MPWNVVGSTARAHLERTVQTQCVRYNGGTQITLKNASNGEILVARGRFELPSTGPKPAIQGTPNHPCLSTTVGGVFLYRAKPIPGLLHSNNSPIQFNLNLLAKVFPRKGEYVGTKRESDFEPLKNYLNSTCGN